MIQATFAASPRRRFCLASGILAAVLFLAVWVPTHPPRPHLPTSDLYTHLSVARHLARDEGFRTDVTYPLSFAFPFARELPQPLIHRQPGFAVLLTIPYLAGEGYPGKTLEDVRRMQIVLLALIIGIGTGVFLWRGDRAAVFPWLLLMFFNPLMVFAVDWGMVEMACALLLLVLWLRMRNRSSGHPDWIDGLLAGGLTMLRLDLFWVPILWWVLARPRPFAKPSMDRKLGLLLLVWLVVVTPWAIRNLQVTGQPFFSLQSYAEHVKDTRDWPGYSVYRQIETQPMATTLTSDPIPVLRKTVRGVKFYVRDLHRLVPLLALLGLVIGTLAFLKNMLGRNPGSSDPRPRGPTALVLLTTILLIFQYAIFDHSLRHLLVILPVMLWEFSWWSSTVATRFAGSRWPGIGTAAAVTLVVVFLFPCRLPGWDSAAEEAVRLAPSTAQQIDMSRLAGPGVLFSESSAVPWFIDRPVVWSPADVKTRARICELLGLPAAEPGGSP